MANKTFKPKTIDITDLTLELSRDGKSVKYAILTLRTNFAIGRFPSVTIVISTGANLYGGTSRSGSVDILQDSPEGALGTVKFKFKHDDSGESSGILFCGYVAAAAPSLATSIYSVTSAVEVQLVCATNAINSMPLGALEYFNAGGGTTVSTIARTYASLNNIIRKGGAHAGKKNAGGGSDKDTSLIAEATKLLATSPGNCITKLIDFARGYVANSMAVSKLEDTVLYAEGALGVQIYSPLTVTEGFFKTVVDGLMAASPSAVFNSMLGQLFLGFVPETCGSEDTPNRVIVWPINAWEPTPAFELELADVLGCQSQTRYRLDQRVDLWYVTLPPLHNQSNPTRIAVYGPPLTNTAGKARCMTQTEFIEKLSAFKEPNTRRLNSLSARHLFLPGWMKSVPARAEAAKDMGKTGSPEVLIEDKNQEKALKTQQDIGERIAINGFLQNGCAVVGTIMQVPFHTYLKLLPYLGLMGKFEWPDAMKSNTKNLTSIPTSTRYGLLHEMSLNLTATGKSISVNCSIAFSSVHDDEMHKQYATKHPMYPAASDLPSYQANAKTIADKL